jgi:hypothetical protein
MIMSYLRLSLLSLTAVSAFSQSASESVDVNMAKSSAQTDYPVEAYICLDDNSEVKNPEACSHGSVLQICVKIDDSLVTQNIVIEDIFTFVISQPDGIAADSEIIANTVVDSLSDNVCHDSGICNVKSQLQSKFFTDADPGDLRVDGVATLAIGNAAIVSGSAPTVEGNTPAVRCLRAHIRGLLTGEDVKAFVPSQQHQIKNKAADESKKTNFGLEVRLQTRAPFTVRRKFVVLEVNPGAIIKTLQATDPTRVAAIVMEVEAEGARRLS